MQPLDAAYENARSEIANDAKADADDKVKEKRLAQEEENRETRTEEERKVNEGFLKDFIQKLLIQATNKRLKMLSDYLWMNFTMNLLYGLIKHSKLENLKL